MLNPFSAIDVILCSTRTANYRTISARTRVQYLRRSLSMALGVKHSRACARDRPPTDSRKTSGGIRISFFSRMSRRPISHRHVSIHQHLNITQQAYHAADYDSPSPSEGSRRFRRELLEHVRRELFATAEQEPGPVEQRLLRRVAGIIQRCENELMASANGASYSPAPFANTSTFLHPAMPTHRRASAPSILAPEEPSPSHTNQPPSRPTLPIHTFPQASDYQQAIPQSFETAAPGGTISPRTTDDFTTMPQPDVNAALQQDPPAIVFQDMVPFPSSEWIDWNFLFPPGSGVDGQADGQRGDGVPQLVSPVWT